MPIAHALTPIATIIEQLLTDEFVISELAFPILNRGLNQNGFRARIFKMSDGLIHFTIVRNPCNA